MVNRRQLLKISALGTASFAAPLAYSASNITMAYNTGNPIGSTSPKDLSDNARNLDYLVNGSDASYLDRKGVPRKSWKGMEGEHNADQIRREAEFDADQERHESSFDEYQARHASEFDAAQTDRATQFNMFMDASGYEDPIQYVPGILLSRVTKTVLYLGNIYRVRTEFMPLTTTNWATDGPKLKLVGDDSLRQDLASVLDASKGVGLIPSALRTVGTVADMAALNGWVAGQSVQTLGYYKPGDGGANIYTIVAKGALIVDGGRYIATSNPSLLFRGEFLGYEVRVKQFGAIYDKDVNDTAPFSKAIAFARTRSFVPVILETGTILIDPYEPANKDTLLGAGLDRTSIKFTAGVYGFKLSRMPIGIVSDRTTPSKDIRLENFTVIADNVDFGMYMNFGLYNMFGDINITGAKICNFFMVYSFRNTFGQITGSSSKGTGIEFGNNRFGWADIVGESPVLNHGNKFKRMSGYDNGKGLAARPNTAGGSIEGAGIVLGPGYDNDTGPIYCEINKGIGVVMLPGMSYTVPFVYLEDNDNFTTGTDVRIELYANSRGASVGDFYTKYSSTHAAWNQDGLVVHNFYGVQVLGPGYTKITGHSKDVEISNPRVAPLLIFSAKGSKPDFDNKNYTLPSGLPPGSSERYQHVGIYRMYPEVTIEDAATLTTGPTVRIFKRSDGTNVYTGTVTLAGDYAAGERVRLAPLNFTWDPNETYRTQLFNLNGYNGRIGFSLYAEVFV